VAGAAGGGRGEVGDSAGMPGEVRRLQVDEVRDRFQGGVQLVTVEVPRARVGRDQRVPPGLGRQIVEQLGGVGEEHLDHLRVELGAAASAGHVDCRGDAPAAVVDLDQIGQVDHPDRRVHGLSAVEEGGLSLEVSQRAKVWRRHRCTRSPRPSRSASWPVT
jgi:hypothetical protein